MLTALGLWGELFHTAVGAAFADIPLKGHRETWPLRSKPVSELVAAVPLRSDGRGGEPSGRPLGPRSPRSARPIRWPRARGPHPEC
jgi:hypothetical protein